MSALPAKGANIASPTLAGVFATHWPAYERRHRARIPAAHRKAAKAILTCRTELRGVVQSVCGGCGQRTVAPLSCGHRACPQCGTAAASMWRDRCVAKLLPVPHFLVTFTVPEELRALLRSHPQAGYAAMFAAHADALATTLREKLGGGGGWTSVLHTWTRQLAFHPHIHSIVAGLVLTPDGLPRRVPKRDYLIPFALLSMRWRDALRSRLAKVRTTAGHFEAALASMPASVWKRAWVVDLQPVGTGEKAMGYLARYVQKTALDHARILASDTIGVTIAWRDRETKKPRQTKLSAGQFLRRFLQHVLPGGLMRIRHGGFYAPAAKARYQRLCTLLAHVNQPAQPWTTKCAKCGGEVFILSIRVGRQIIVPQRTCDHYRTLLEERPP